MNRTMRIDRSLQFVLYLAACVLLLGLSFLLISCGSPPPPGGGQRLLADEDVPITVTGGSVTTEFEIGGGSNEFQQDPIHNLKFKREKAKIKDLFITTETKTFFTKRTAAYLAVLKGQCDTSITYSASGGNDVTLTISDQGSGVVIQFNDAAGPPVPGSSCADCKLKNIIVKGASGNAVECINVFAPSQQCSWDLISKDLLNSTSSRIYFLSSPR